MTRRPLHTESPRGLPPGWRIGATVALVLLAGCAGGKWRVPGDISTARQTRRAEAARHFQATKEQAEIEDARSLLSRHDFSGCRERLERVLASNPGQREAKLLLAEVLLVEGRPTEAISLLDPLAEGHEDDAAIQHALGLARDAAGDSDRALAHYERAARSRPENELYRLSYQRARSAIQATAIVPASFHDSVQPAAPQPSSRPASTPTGSLASAGGGEPIGAAKARAEERSDKAGAPIPDRGNQEAPGTPANRPGERPGAPLRDGREDARSNPESAIEQASAFMKENQPERAVGLLQAALKDSPRSAGVYRALGMAYYRLGDYRSAQDALQQALSLDNRSGLSYFLMGCTLARLGQREAAEVQFRQARALDPQWAARLPAATASPPNAMR